MQETDSHVAAKRRVEMEYASLLVHLSAYIAVVLLLILINLLAALGGAWVVWPLVGWGVVISLHALRVIVQDAERITPVARRSRSARNQRRSETRPRARSGA